MSKILLILGSKYYPDGLINGLINEHTLLIGDGAHAINELNLTKRLDEVDIDKDTLIVICAQGYLESNKHYIDGIQSDTLFKIINAKNNNIEKNILLFSNDCGKMHLSLKDTNMKDFVGRSSFISLDVGNGYEVGRIADIYDIMSKMIQRCVENHNEHLQDILMREIIDWMPSYLIKNIGITICNESSEIFNDTIFGLSDINCSDSYIRADINNAARILSQKFASFMHHTNYYIYHHNNFSNVKSSMKFNQEDTDLFFKRVTRCLVSEKSDEAILDLLNNNAKFMDHMMHSQDSYGITPFMMLMSFGHLKSAEALIQSGVDVNQLDNNGYTPLLHAVLKKQLNSVQFLIENKARLDMRYDGNLVMEYVDNNHAIHEYLLNTLISSYLFQANHQNLEKEEFVMQVLQNITETNRQLSPEQYKNIEKQLQLLHDDLNNVNNNISDNFIINIIKKFITKILQILGMDNSAKQENDNIKKQAECDDKTSKYITIIAQQMNDKKEAYISR